MSWVNTKEHSLANTTINRLTSFSKSKLMNMELANMETHRLQAHAQLLWNEMLSQTNDNRYNKRFWSFMKSRRHESSQLSTLKDHSGRFISESKVNADILNQQLTIICLHQRWEKSIKDQQDISIYTTQSRLRYNPWDSRDRSKLTIEKSKWTQSCRAWWNNPKLLKSVAHESWGCSNSTCSTLYTLISLQSTIPKDWRHVRIIRLVN